MPDSREWNKRSHLWGATLRSVLFKSFPDVLNEHLNDWHKRVVLQSIEYKKRMKVLDVGCGYGRLSLPILREFPEIETVGLDVSENFVELYKEQTGFPAYVGSLETMPVELGEYDFILCVTALMYVNENDLDSAISNLYVHLKARGQLVLIEPDRSGLPFQTGFGVLTFIRKFAGKSEINTGGNTFNYSILLKRLGVVFGEPLSVSRMPFTTMNILPLYIVSKILPYWVVKRILAVVDRIDRLLEKYNLPSIYTAVVFHTGGK